MTATAYINRELSWLEFNRRVLEEAQDPTVPLLERVKFLAIFSSNLDEFFMVRVAGLKRHAGMGEPAPGPDGLTASETLAAISERVHELVGAQHRCFLDEIQPLLAAEGVRILRPDDLDTDQRRFLDQYFRRALLPVVTPLAIDPGHPFPHLANRSLCLVASSTPASSSSTMPASPNTCSPHPTGCREISTIASRPPSPSSIAGSSAASATSSTCSLRTP
jgi:polyphosphate kinase